MLPVVSADSAPHTGTRWPDQPAPTSTVCVEATVGALAQRVREAIADVGAVHRRLLPGRVANARIEGDVRILTMPCGAQVREIILAIEPSI